MDHKENYEKYLTAEENRTMRDRPTSYAYDDVERNPALKRFPADAREKIDSKIHQKMYDYYKKANMGKESYISMDYFGKKYSFEWLNQQIEIYAKALKGYGILPGDYISVLLPNIPEFPVVELAINRVGAVANVIDPRFNPNYVLELVNNSNSKIVICIESRYKTCIKPIRDRLRVKDVFTISPFESIKTHEIGIRGNLKETFSIRSACIVSRILKKFKAHDIRVLLSRGRSFNGEIDAHYKENAPAVVLYTSGTTGGLLKGAVHTNEGFNALHAELEYAFPEERAGMIISGLMPMSVSYGNGVGMFNSLVAGFQIKMHPVFKPHDLVEIVEQDKPNIMVGVPKFFQMMADSGKTFDYISHMIIGGDKILPNKIEEFRSIFPKTRIAVGYGETEFLGVVSVTLSNDERPDSSGVPLPGMTIKVLDHDNHAEVPLMQEGEAYITGLTQMVGYLNRPDETKMITYYDGKTGKKYFATGDIVKMTPNGEIIFLDRIKRLMKRPDGHQVNADSIEKALSAVEGTKEICVVGLKYKDIMGVIPTAFIKSISNRSTKELVDAYEKASIDKLPSCRDKALAYVFVDEMPYTSNGKVDALGLAKKKLEETSNAIIVDYSFLDR